jgi:microcystin-dependent protein
MTAASLLVSAVGDTNLGGFLVPAGTIFSYAGNTVPSGWLACDGSAVSRTVYANLFASLATTFGVGDGSTTFNVPDFRGRFLRYNDNQGVGAAGRDAARAHGSIQGQATAKNNLAASSSSSVSDPSHRHNTIKTAGLAIGTNASGFADSPGGSPFNVYSEYSNTGISVGTTTNISSSDTETRPINLSVYSIIKI